MLDIFQTRSKPITDDYYGKMMAEMIDECLKEFLDSDQSDTLGEFSFNKAISELAKFKPEFKEAFEKEPSTALKTYRDDILYYMENATFPVKETRADCHQHSLDNDVARIYLSRHCRNRSKTKVVWGISDNKYGQVPYFIRKRECHAR